MAYAAFGLLTELQDSEFDCVEDLGIFSNPMKKVVANKAFDAPGKFVLFPETTAITSVTVDKFEHWDNKAVILQFEPSLPGYVFTAEPCTAEKNQHAFWYVLETTTTDAEEASLQWAKIAVSSLAGFDFLGDIVPIRKKKLTGKQKEPAAGEDRSFSQLVKIPILLNSKALAPGDELKLYRPAGVKRKAKYEPITPAKILKGFPKA